MEREVKVTPTIFRQCLGSLLIVLNSIMLLVAQADLQNVLLEPNLYQPPLLALCLSRELSRLFRVRSAICGQHIKSSHCSARW